MDIPEKDAVELVKKVIAVCLLFEEFQSLSSKDQATILHTAAMTIRK